MGKLKKIAASTFASAVCLLLASPVAAGSVTIRPHQLIRADNFTSTEFHVHPDKIEMHSGGGEFFAPVKLPVGVKVKRLEYLHYLGNEGSVVSLYQSRHQAGEETQEWFHADFPPDSFYHGEAKMVYTDAPIAGISRVVTRGVFHWVRVIAFTGSAIGSIRIYWER